MWRSLRRRRRPATMRAPSSIPCGSRLSSSTATCAKYTFLATLSHELRTTRTSMVAWVRMLRSGRLDEAATARALESIERNTRTQTELIEDLLDVSRITSGKVGLNLLPLDVGP